MSPSDPPTGSSIYGKNTWGTSSLSNAQKVWFKKYRTEVAASSASLIATGLAYPLDSIKTRIQTYKFPSVWTCVRLTYQQEGLHGFWRGTLAPLLSISTVRTLSLSVYQKSKYAYDDLILKATGVSPLEHANTKGAYPNIYTAACFGASGATSGALVTFVSCPFELTKLGSQISVLMDAGTDTKDATAVKPAAPAKVNGQSNGTGAGVKTMGNWAACKLIVRKVGFMGLYSGFHLHIFRDIIGTTLYFSTYESIKQVLANARGNSPSSPLPVVFAGGMCGLVSWVCIYPIDSAKSIYQRNALLSHVGKGPPAGEPQQTTKIEWLSKRMYRGLGISMVRSCLVNAMFFSGFEFLKKQINKIEVEVNDDA